MKIIFDNEVVFDEDCEDGNCIRSYFDGPIPGADISLTTEEAIPNAVKGRRYRLIVQDLEDN